jgi:hypothetical protein
MGALPPAAGAAQPPKTGPLQSAVRQTKTGIPKKQNEKITAAMALGPVRLSLRIGLGAGVAMCAILNMSRDSGVIPVVTYGKSIRNHYPIITVPRYSTRVLYSTTQLGEFQAKETPSYTSSCSFITARGQKK